MADAEEDWDVDLRLTLSAPPVVDTDKALIRDLDRVADDARQQVMGEKIRRRGRKVRPVAVAGALILSVFGGAVAAVADGGFTWLPWAHDPDVTHVFQLPSGRECEERIILKRTWFGGDWDQFVADAGQLEIDEAAVHRKALEIREPGAVIPRLHPSGQLEDPRSLDAPAEDDWYATAWHLAIGQELVRLAHDAGLGVNWSSDSQLQCQRVAAP